jgi:sigma-70-like protein
MMAMHCLHQMDQREIADGLGLSRGTVAASIFRARRELEKALGMTDTDLAAVEKPGSAITRANLPTPADPMAVVLEEALSSLLARMTGGAESLALLHRKVGLWTGLWVRTVAGVLRQRIGQRTVMARPPAGRGRASSFASCAVVIAVTMGRPRPRPSRAVRSGARRAKGWNR